uniref:Secreted protein n=1 Tax=Panagrellus redivivus TaxID=6233 RepID=A0A7E4VGC7_PANRE
MAFHFRKNILISFVGRVHSFLVDSAPWLFCYIVYNKILCYKNSNHNRNFYSSCQCTSIPSRLIRVYLNFLFFSVDCTDRCGSLRYCKVVQQPPDPLSSEILPRTPVKPVQRFLLICYLPYINLQPRCLEFLIPFFIAILARLLHYS